MYVVDVSNTLGLGKVTKEIFNRSVLPYLPIDKNLELDGATTRFSGNTVIAHSPSIGVPIEALGFFSFHYAASNVASRFGKPTHMISGIYLPLKTRESDLRVIAKSLGDEAKKYGVIVTAGQTATYFGLEIPLLTSTCMGGEVRSPEKPRVGDSVLLVGEVGGEAVWLDRLAKGREYEGWMRFTPLPVILSLQNVDQVRIMHDVSEGGIIGALYEIVESHKVIIDASSDSIVYAEGVTELDGEILRAPTYGALITIVCPDGVNEVKKRCQEIGVPCIIIGSVFKGNGLTLDGEPVTEQRRIDIDEIYGSFPGDE
jgi:hydrogenase maturation factor